MNTVQKEMSATTTEVKEDFNLGAAITVMLLLLIFVAASFYVLVSSYLDVH